VQSDLLALRERQEQQVRKEQLEALAHKVILAQLVQLEP
jgi:hypothetical protein